MKASTAAAILAFCATSAVGAPVQIERRQPEAEAEPLLKALAENFGGFGGIPGLQAAATLFGRDAPPEELPEPFRKALAENFGGFGGIPGLHALSTVLGKRNVNAEDQPEVFLYSDEDDVNDNEERDASAEPFLGRASGPGARFGLRIGGNLLGLDDKRDLSALEARDAEAEPFLGRAFGSGAKLGLRIGSNLLGLDDKRDLSALEARDAEAEPFLGRAFGSGAKLGLRIGSQLFGLDDKRDLSAVEKRHESADVDETPELFLYTDDEVANEKRDASPEPFLRAFGSGAKLGLRIGSNLFGFGDDE